MQFAHRNRLLLFIAVAVSGLTVVALLIPALRAFAALALVFYIPGHAIVLLFRKDTTASHDRILYASGLNLAAVIAGGFFLHIFGSMTPVQWAVLLISASAFAFAFRAAPQRLPSIEQPRPRHTWRVSGLEALMFAGAAILTVGAFAIDWREAMAHSEFKYTEFWMVAEDPGKPNALTAGVKNEEGEPASYDIEYTVDGQIAGQSASFRLAPGEVWTSALNTGIRADRVQRVEAWLFKNGDRHTVYRRVWADIGIAGREDL